MAHTRKKEPAPQIQASDPAAGGDAIAKLAYELWSSRGCPDGSPEQDWYEAERILKGGAEPSRKSNATARGA